MATDVDTRISRLLDQLERPGLTESEIQRIEDKIRFLRSIKEPSP
jgi:hypothetical protein